MANVSVEKIVVQKSIALCEQSIMQFEQSSKRLQGSYQAAGAGWRDAKYRQLGGIVNECTTALTRPMKELEACRDNLRKLLANIEEYEDINLK